jgi:hypothetical protein
MSRLFGPMRQVGIVVRDIEKAMRHWVEVCGVGPWFYAEQLPMDEFGIVKLTWVEPNGIKTAMNSHEAATAICQLLTASALKIRSVEREITWRWRLKVLWRTA